MKFEKIEDVYKKRREIENKVLKLKQEVKDLEQDLLFFSKYKKGQKVVCNCLGHIIRGEINNIRVIDPPFVTSLSFEETLFSYEIKSKYSIFGGIYVNEYSIIGLEKDFSDDDILENMKKLS